MVPSLHPAAHDRHITWTCSRTAEGNTTDRTGTPIVFLFSFVFSWSKGDPDRLLTNRRTNSPTDGQIDRQTERQTDRQTDMSNLLERLQAADDESPPHHSRKT